MRRKVVYGLPGPASDHGYSLSTAFGESPWLEYMDDGPFWQPKGFQVGFRETVPIDSDGYVHCPQAGRLGIDWDMGWLRRIGLT